MDELLSEWGIDEHTKRARVGQSVRDLLSQQAAEVHQVARKDFEQTIKDAVASAQATANAECDKRVDKLMEAVRGSQTEHMKQVDEKLERWKGELDLNVQNFRKELDDFKQQHDVSALPSGGSPPSSIGRSRSLGMRSSFAPGKVFVTGFYNWQTSQGALKREQRDKLAADLMAAVPEHVKRQFSLETRYNLTRRLVFTTKDVGEPCWILREHLMHAIESGDFEWELKVRVEESPERRAKRDCYWRAVDALKKLVPERELILEPAAFGIYHEGSCTSLGRIHEDGFVWAETEIAKYFPSVSMPNLRRACLQKRS